MSENNIHSGDVEIVLEGHGAVKLRPTLDAAIRLSAMPGGITKMVDRCLNYEFNAIHEVIATGLGSPSKDLPKIIYLTGLITLSPACIEFLHVVANGGRPVGNDDLSDEEPADPLANSSQ